MPLIGIEFYPLMVPNTPEDRFDKLLNNPSIYEGCAEEYRKKIANIDSQFQLHMNAFMLCKRQPREIVKIFQETTEYFNSVYWTWDSITNIHVGDELRRIQTLILAQNSKYENIENLKSIFFTNLNSNTCSSG